MYEYCPVGGPIPVVIARGSGFRNDVPRWSPYDMLAVSHTEVWLDEFAYYLSREEIMRLEWLKELR